MSRITTSCASLSWAIAAMRRACSSGVSESSSPFGCGRSVPTVEAVLANQLGHACRHEIVDRVAARDTVADVARRNGQRLELEEQHTLGVREPLEDGVEALARVAGARSDAETSKLEYALRILPRQKVAELVRADEEQRVAPAPGAQGVDGPRVLVELDIVVRERGACELEPRRRVENDLLVPRPSRDEHDELVESELPLRGRRERDVTVVRRVERTAEQPDQGAATHCHSRMSPATSTSSPARIPAARSAASSSWGSSGDSPAIR